MIFHFKSALKYCFWMPSCLQSSVPWHSLPSQPTHWSPILPPPLCSDWRGRTSPKSPRQDKKFLKTPTWLGTTGTTGLERFYGPKNAQEKQSIPQVRVGSKDLRTAEIQILADHASELLHFLIFIHKINFKNSYKFLSALAIWCSQLRQ